MSPRDRCRKDLYQNDRRELLAYREKLYQILKCADDLSHLTLEEMDRLDKAILEDEEELVALARKYGLAWRYFL